MERRNKSIKALKELQNIDSFEEDVKVLALDSWVDEYLQEDIQKSFDLNLNDLNKLSELFYKNINFMKIQHENLKEALNQNKSIKKYFT